jgi:hypothetical protein
MAYDARIARDSDPVPAALSEVQPSFVIVVRPASQLDLIDTRLAAESVGVLVMELDEPALVAAVAGRSDEGAAPEIPDPDYALHRGGDVPRPRLVPTRRLVATRRARLLRVREPLPGQVGEQQGERSRTAASSPLGIAWPSMSLASLSFSSVSPPIVSDSL